MCTEIKITCDKCGLNLIPTNVITGTKYLCPSCNVFELEEYYNVNGRRPFCP